MNNKRYFSFALALAAVALTFAFQGVAAFNSSWPFQAHAATQQQRLDRRAFELQLDSMREMHRRMVSAESAVARHSLLQASETIMLNGLEMVLRLNPGNSMPSAGSLISGTVIEAETEGLKDFMVLMELLVEMKVDQELALRPHRSRSQDIPMTQLIQSGARIAHLEA